MLDKLIDALGWHLIIPGIVGGLVGSLTIAVITHLLTKNRDKATSKAARKRTFLAFMRSWQAVFRRGQWDKNLPESPCIGFVDTLPKFASEAEMIKGDVPKGLRTEFDSLVSKVSRTNYGDFGSQEKDAKIHKMFEDIISIAEDT